jgi:hypothetical protein
MHSLLSTTNSHRRPPIDEVTAPIDASCAMGVPQVSSPVADQTLGAYSFFSTAALFSFVRIADSSTRNDAALLGGISMSRTTYSLS